MRRNLILAVAGLALMTALPALAQIVPSECARGLADVRVCGLPSLIGVFVRIAQWIFGIAGAVALALFIYGGFVWLTSGGSPEKIQKGRQILVNTVIALFIIFGAYAGVQFLLSALRGGPSATPVIEGERCLRDEKEGTAYLVGGALICATECSHLGDEGYSCQTPGAGKECVAGLCPGGADNVCCRAAPAPVSWLFAQPANAAESCNCSCTYSGDPAAVAGGLVADQAACRTTCEANAPEGQAVEAADCTIIPEPEAAPGGGVKKPDWKGPAKYEEGAPAVDLTTPEYNPLGTLKVPELIGRIIRAFIGLAGSIALVVFIYGGFVWLTSAGSPEKIKKGRDILLWAGLGLLLIFASYALVNFVLVRLVGVL